MFQISSFCIGRLHKLGPCYLVNPGEGGEAGHSAETGRQAVDISPNVPGWGKGTAYFKLKGPAREGVIQDIWKGPVVERSLTRKKGSRIPWLLTMTKMTWMTIWGSWRIWRPPLGVMGGDRVGGGTKGVEGVVATTAQAVDSVVNQPPNVAFMVWSWNKIWHWSSYLSFIGRP